jgi:alkylation response protein AidB-like acyl-CoA dehydrogenase
MSQDGGVTQTLARLPALVPPPVDLPPRAAQLRAEVRTFLAAERAAGAWSPRSDVWLSGWDERFTRELGKRGWLGMTIPEEYGGKGASPLDRYVVTEELLAAGAPVAAHWVADRQIGPTLMRFGTEEQRRRFLPGIAAGEVYFGIGMSEPDSGSDLASVRTKAEKVDGGWELTGTKVWTSGAHHAHAFFALARSAPRDEKQRHAGLSQFIVELDAPGVQIRPIPLLTGAHHFNEVVFDRVFVPDAMVLGEIGSGWHQVTSELAFERSGPERFLSTFPLLTALVGELAAAGHVDAGARRALGSLVARVWTLRRMSLAIAGALESGQAPELAAAVVKDLGTRYENEVIDAARLLVAVPPDPGAEAGYARLLADAVLHAPGFTLRGGTNEVLRGIVARGMGLR